MRTAVHNTDPLPISHYWGLIKDIDSSQKLELAAMLIDSLKPIVASSMHDTTDGEDFLAMKKEHLKPYTMAEIDAMLDEAEAAFEAGDYLTQDEVFHHRDAMAV